MIKWEDLLDISSACLASLNQANAPTDESERRFNESLARTAINRAYYGAFHAACLYAGTNGYNKRYQFNRPIRGGVHERLWEWFKDHGRPDISAVGMSLKRRRIVVDYKLPLNGTHIPDPAIMLHESAQLCESLFPGSLQPAQPVLIDPNNP